MNTNTSLTRCVHRLIARHGSVRAAARACRLDAGYLSRLSSGEKTAPSDAALRKLGFNRIVFYSDKIRQRSKP